MRSYRVGDEPIPGYKLLKKLGSGGFGEVWKASAPGGAELALKIVGLQRKQGYKEFRALNLIKFIHHPNLTPVHAFWLKDEDGYVLDAADPTREALLMPPVQKANIRSTMVVESPAGQPAELIIAMGLGSMSLYDRLMQCRSQGMPGIPPGELLEYMEDAAKAIDFLNSPVHDMGSGPTAIQHCDIKPQNILLVGNAAQVCDFGLARGINDIRTSGAAGSPAYSAPECISANKPSPQTDQYSFAISYYELRTGELPFEDDSSYMAVATAHLNGRLVLTGLPEDERKVIQRATALNPADRFESTTKMVRALRRACPEAEDSTVIPPPPTSEMDVGNGYRLVEPLVRSSGEEIWAAVAPGGKKVAVLVRALKDPVTAVDQQALCLTRDMRHQRLAEIHGWWFLDTGGRVIPDNLRGSPGSATPNKLVLVGKLASGNLVHRLQECRDETGGGIPPAELLRYMEQLAEAIDYLNSPKHSIGGRTVSIQHCNLRPSNFLLDDSGLRLGNFALSKALPGASIAVSHETFGAESPYVAPEVLQGRLTTTSDQFVLGVNYVHLRTGKLPFDAAGSTRTIIAQQRDGMDLSSLTFVEAEAVRRATSDDPQARFPNCKAFVAALRSSLQPSGGVSDSRMTEDFRQAEGSPGSSPRAGAEELGEVVATMALPITETPSVVRDTIQTPERPGPAAQEIEQILRRPDSIPPKKPRRAGRRLAAVGLLVLACGGSAAALYSFLKPEQLTSSSIETEVMALAGQSQFLAAWDKVEASTPPLTESEADRIRGQINAAFEQYVEIRLREIEQQPAAEQILLIDAFERDAREFLGRVPPDGRAETLFAEIAALKNPAARAALAESLTRANELLASDQLQQAAEHFGQVIAADAARGSALETEARLGRARAKARMRAWDDLRSDLDHLSRAKNLDNTHRPVLDTLQAIALANASPLDNFKVLQALKPLYRDGQLVASYAKLPEAKHLQEEKQKAIDRTLALAVIPDDQRQLAGLIQPGLFDVELFLQQAEKHLGAQQYAQARGILANAIKRVGASSDHPRLTALAWRIELEDPSGDLVPTVAAILKSVKEQNLSSQVDQIALALARRAAGKSEVRPAALEVLEYASHYVVGEQLAELRRLRLALEKESVWEQLADATPDDFNKLLDRCYSLGKEAEADPLIRLVLAESLLQTSGQQLPSDTVVRLIKHVSDDAPLEDERIAPYAHYVRATVLRALPRAHHAKGLAELAKLTPFLSSGSLPAVLQVPHRKRNAAQLLVQAAAELRTRLDVYSVDSVLSNPFGDEKQAELAYQWLNTAVPLLTKQDHSPDLLTNYVLAAYYRSERDVERVRSALKELAPSISTLRDDQRVPILLVQSRVAAKNVDGLLNALRSTADLAAMWGGPSLKQHEAVRLSREVLDPVIGEAEKMLPDDVGAKQALARLYGLKGQLIDDYPGADWSLGRQEQSQHILRAYSRAVELDPTRPEYLVHRGEAYLELPEPDLDRAVADATTALKLSETLKLNDQMAAAYGLRGHCRINQAAKASQLEVRTKLLGQAIDDLKVATADSAAKASDRAIRHVDASIASVLLASNVRDRTWKLQEDLLQGAVKHAEAAIDLGYHLEAAYRSLGNASEDLAWMIGPSKPALLENYDRAIEAFNAATAEDPADFDNYMYRARCNLKRVVDGGQSKRYLDESVRDLEPLLQDPNMNKLPELHYWLGKLYSAQDKWQEADAALAQALKLEGTGGLAALYAITRASNAVSNQRLSAADRAAHVRRCADELARCKPGHGSLADPAGLAAYYYGQAEEAEGNTKAALQTYADALQATSDSYALEQLLDASAAARLKTRDFAGTKADGLALVKAAQSDARKAKGFAYAGEADYQVATAKAGGDLASMDSAQEFLEQSIELDPRKNSVTPRATLMRVLDYKIHRPGVTPTERTKLAQKGVAVVNGSIDLADDESKELLRKFRRNRFEPFLPAPPKQNAPPPVKVARPRPKGASK